MADERVLATKLEHIERYHGELLEKRNTLTLEQLQADVTEQPAVERMFENVIQACADLAKHIAASDFAFDGDRSQDAVRVLVDLGVVDENARGVLIDAIGFRNVLAHLYGVIEYDIVYERLQTRLDIFTEFSRQIAESQSAGNG